MKSLILGISFLLSVNAFAELPAKLNHAPCRHQIQKQMKKWQSKNDWQEKAPLLNKALQYTSPTNTFGQWVSIAARPDGHYLLKKKQWTWFESVEINNKCRVASLQRHMISTSTTGVAWSDRDVQQISKASRPTLVYIWSPDMEDSVTHHQTYVRAARDLKMNFVSMLDPQSGIESARQALKGTKYAESYLSTRRLQSLELIQRNGTNDFPTAFVINRRNISNPIVGVLDSPDLKRKLQRHLVR